MTLHKEPHHNENWKYLDALQVIVHTFGSSISSQQIFQLTLDTIIRVTGMDGAGFRILDKNKNCFRLVGKYDISPDLIDYLKSIPAGNPIHGEVLRTHQPVIISDMTRDPRVANREVLKLGHRSLICVPVLCGNELVGTIDLLSYQYYQWSEPEIRWLMSIGRILGLEIRHVQLKEQVREISILEERQRISWELHDSLAQMISSIKVRTETIDLILEKGDQEKLQKVISEIAEISDDAYESLRDEILGLRGAVREKGMIVTISEHLKRFERQWGIKTCFHYANCNHDFYCPPCTELQILRIFQEAVTNVRRHAHASQLDVTLEAKDEWIQLEISDNGQGFEQAGIEEEKHVGLRIMRERAESIGGDFDLQTSPGRGTRMVARLPIKVDYYL